MEDEDGMHTNYVSFAEAEDKGQAILDEMTQLGRAEVFYNWQDVIEKFGHNARLTKLGCIVKQKPDGGEKVRIIVDSRRSGVNGMVTLRERVVLPRVTDVTQSWRRLVTETEGLLDAELYSADFKDAFNMLTLCRSERPYTIVKGKPDSHGTNRYCVFSLVVFGLAPGPLLWGRVAAAAMRLAQSALLPNEAEVQTFVDDPVVIAVGQDRRTRTWMFAVYSAVWRILGLDVSWKKAQRGMSLDWIGFHLTVHNSSEGRNFIVQLKEDKKVKLEAVISDLCSYKGVMPLKQLQLAVGILGWITSAMPLARPFVAMIWAAILQQRKPVHSSTRVRKGLIFVRQVEHALRWLQTLLRTMDETHQGLKHVVRWRPNATVCLSQTDACPTGMGGFLMHGKQILAYWYDSVTALDEMFLGCKVGHPSHQSELELLAVLVSVKVFQKWLVHESGPSAILFRADNTSTLAATLELRGRSPIMALVAADLALELEALQVPHIWGQHVAGILNDIADRLSRMSELPELPHVLTNVHRVPVPRRDRSFYRSWPEVQT